jgi:hypoxanthine phosphoribosyltransferase
MIQVLDKQFEVLISQHEIEQKIKILAHELSEKYTNKNPIFLGILNGSFMFAAELFKNLSIEAEICFLRVQSYTETASTGLVKEVLGLTESIENKDVVILEDIVDTGITMEQILLTLKAKNPRSIAIATLLFKPKALQKPVTVDYFCFEIEPKFVIGYGLDYNGLGRNLADIYVLKESL